MVKVFISVVFLLAFAAIVTEATLCKPLFKDCGSVTGKVLDFTFNGSCTPDKHLILKEGTNAYVIMKLQSDDTSKTLTTKVHGIIYGRQVPFPLPNPNACVNCNITCPIQSGKQYYYAPSMLVPKIHIKVKLVIKWEVYDDNKKDLICVLVPAIVTD